MFNTGSAGFAVRCVLALVLAAAFAQPSRRAWAGEPSVADMVNEGKAPKGNEKAKAAADDDEPYDEFNRTTPRSAVEGFLKAAIKHDYGRAAEYLDLRRMPKKVAAAQGPDLARKLKAVLDRTLWVDLDALSNLPKGRKKDGLPDYRERVGWIETPSGEKVEVLLQRTTSENGVSIWKFSSATVAQIVDLYAIFGYGFLEDYLPEVFFQYEVAQVPVVEWAGLIVLTLVASVFAYLLTGVFNWILRRRTTPAAAQLSGFVTGPVRLVIGVGILSAGTSLLRLTVFARAWLGGLENALLVVAVAWTVLRLLDLFGARLMQRLVDEGQAHVVYLIPPGRKAVKGVIVALAFIAMLDSFGFDVTALIAGLGVGGIAIALGAQKTLENMFGGLTLFTNQPVRVGDFCRFGDKIGTVEEIGLYSTRVRTLDRTVIAMPNSQFASMQLENFARRDKIWYHPTIGLRYETTPDQLRYILVEIRKMLYSHPKVDPEPARIRFTTFSAYSLDLEIFAYVKATDFGEFLEIAEDLNLRIMDIVAAAGSSFAFPSQTTYVEQGEGLDRHAGEKAESEVAAWRQRRELYLPKFPPEKIGELSGKLDYPPEGSPLATNGGPSAAERR